MEHRVGPCSLRSSMTAAFAFSPSLFTRTPSSTYCSNLPQTHTPSFRSGKRISASNTPNNANTTSYETGKIKANLRVFLDDTFISGQTLTLAPLELRHLRARRAQDGDTLLLFNRAGCTATAILQGSNAAVLEVSSSRPQRPSISAVIGLPKSASRTDWIIEKLTELGVASISFCCTARSLRRPTQAKIERWHRLAAAAAKQSLRTELPDISVLPFDHALEEVERHAAPILFCSGGLSMLSEECTAPVKASATALLLIGPEGGFDEAEIDALVRAGAVKVGLGNLRLRVETATVVAAGVVSQLLIQISSSEREAG